MTHFQRLPHFSTIDPNDPWNPDHLNRKPIADQLTKLITSLNQPYVLSINSPWGTGKTEFLRRWRADLENQGYACIHFDAWSNDFAEDPFFAFMGEIKKYVDEITNNDEESKKANHSHVKEAWKQLIKFGGNFLEKSPKHLARFLTYQALKQGINLADFAEDLCDENSDSSQDRDSTPNQKTFDDAAKMISGITAEAVSGYQKKQEYREGFRKALTKFAHSLKAKDEENPLIILVDELDRCRPDYALELLERIKHLFYADDVVFLLAVDKTQLCNTICTVYGQGINPETYLRKFIDIEFTLPTPSCSNFFDYLSAKFKMEGLVQPYPQNGNDYSEFKELFVSLSQAFRLSLRDQAQIMTRLSIIYRVYNKENSTVARFIAALVMMSFHKSRIDKIFFDPQFEKKVFSENDKSDSNEPLLSYMRRTCDLSATHCQTTEFIMTAYKYLSTPDKNRKQFYYDMEKSLIRRQHRDELTQQTANKTYYTVAAFYDQKITHDYLRNIIEMSKAFESN
ncbi:hypothetical protein JCM16814_17940 [Desulfobaculum senezii]